MKTYRAVSLGLPESGKTAYLSCAISYLVRNDENWQLKGANKDFLSMMNDTEDIMRSGAWPDKTRSNNILEFKVSNESVLVTDWMGEMFEALIDFEAYRDCPEEMKHQFRDSLREATHLLIFIDGTTIHNHNTTKRIQHCLSGLQLMLEEFHKAEAESKKISFIVTKSDELTGIEPFCDNTGEPQNHLLEDTLGKNFWTFFRYIKDESDWLSVKFYSVSCVPIKQHRQTTLDSGTVATREWSVEDMLQQVTPIKAIQEEISAKNLVLVWGMVVGGAIIGSCIWYYIGLEKPIYFGGGFGGIITGMVLSRNFRYSMLKMIGCMVIGGIIGGIIGKIIGGENAWTTGFEFGVYVGCLVVILLLRKGNK